MAKGRMMNKRIAKSDKIASLAKDRDRVIYFMIYPHLDCEGRYSGDARDIKEDCCPRLPYTITQITESLLSLHESGLITLYIVDNKQYLEASRFDDFQVGLHKEREAKSEIPPNPGPTPEVAGLNPAVSPKIPLNLNLKFKSKFKYKDNGALRASVIDYLNERAVKKFNPGSKATVQIINARLEEGKTIEDFKRVIDIKVGKWKDDPKMDDYLRPETLFNRTKMEAYLNEQPAGALEVGRRAAQVGARPPKTSEQKELDKKRREAARIEIERLDKIYNPRIEAATGEGADKLKCEVRRKIERFCAYFPERPPINPACREACLNPGDCEGCERKP